MCVKYSSSLNITQMRSTEDSSHQLNTGMVLQIWPNGGLTAELGLT